MRHFAPRWILRRGEQQKVDSYDAAISSGWIHNEIRIVYGFYRSTAPVAQRCPSHSCVFTCVALGKN